MNVTGLPTLEVPAPLTDAEQRFVGLTTSVLMRHLPFDVAAQLSEELSVEAVEKFNVTDWE